MLPQKSQSAAVVLAAAQARMLPGGYAADGSVLALL
jgi:hypothetical protein